MFSFYKKHNNQLYNKLVRLSRNIYFYDKLGLEDNFQTRIILIFMHLSIILIILKKRKIKFPQEIYDNIFLNIEYHSRELGDGDVAVNKKMKILNKVFYDILLKLNVDDSNKFMVNKNVIKKHFSIKLDKDHKILLQISDYLESFYDFCFVLEDDSMIEGKIDFKY